MPHATLFAPDYNNDALHRALLALGDDWHKNGGAAFSTSFISAPGEIRDNILVSWPEQSGPQDSLLLLAQDIEEHLHAAAHELHTDFFGLALTNVSDARVFSPYTLLYDLETGLKTLPLASGALINGLALWVDYQPLEGDDADSYLRTMEEQEGLLVQGETLDKLQVWEKNFSRMLALAQADAAMTMDAQTSLLGLLNQGRVMSSSLVMTKTLSGNARSAKVRAATEKMQGAITQQLANGGLPEILRKALRMSLGDLREAAQQKSIAWTPKALPLLPKAALSRTFKAAATTNLIRLPVIKSKAPSSPHARQTVAHGERGKVLALRTRTAVSPNFMQTTGATPRLRAPTAASDALQQVPSVQNVSPSANHSPAAAPLLMASETPQRDAPPPNIAAIPVVENKDAPQSQPVTDAPPGTRQTTAIPETAPKDLEAVVPAIPVIPSLELQPEPTTTTAALPSPATQPTVISTPTSFESAIAQPPMPTPPVTPNELVAPDIISPSGNKPDTHAHSPDQNQPNGSSPPASPPEKNEPGGLLDEMRRADENLLKQFHDAGCPCCAPTATTGTDEAPPTGRPSDGLLPTILEGYKEQEVRLTTDDGNTVNIVAAFNAESGKQATTKSTDNLLDGLTETLRVNPDPPLCRDTGEINCNCASKTQPSPN